MCIGHVRCIDCGGSNFEVEENVFNFIINEKLAGPLCNRCFHKRASKSSNYQRFIISQTYGCGGGGVSPERSYACDNIHSKGVGIGGGGS
jgi:hypothetical protein